MFSHTTIRRGMTKHFESKNDEDSKLILSETSLLGSSWVPIYKTNADFGPQHFEKAMLNLIKSPNINSTVIMRADILKENMYDPQNGFYTFVSKYINEEPKFTFSDNTSGVPLHRYLDDASLKSIPLNDSSLELKVKCEVVRRIIPRNPFKDYIINQSCLVMTGVDTVFIAYVPHIKEEKETPFYLPPVAAVGILYHNSFLSIHFLPFSSTQEQIRSLEWTERPIRIALRLLQTSKKHSMGAKDGYQKRVQHDLIVPKVSFQNRYISLKRRYSSQLVNQWCESTDPKKHVFEDIAIAAFLIEFWALRYENKSDFEFRDLGCGNGLLVHILIMEGFKGQGIDARARKSWSIYPENVQKSLKEQVIIPSVLLKPHPALQRMAPHVSDNGRYFQIPEYGENSTQPLMTFHSASSLMQSPKVCTTDDFPSNTFIIGNHSDELTCWIPLLGFPFMVIPCCSHSLSGAKLRYNPTKKKKQTNGTQSISTYASLVNHVEELSSRMGWVVEKEMLRIPSTRNASIIGTRKNPPFDSMDSETLQTKILDIVAIEGGAEGWVENSIALTKKSVRNH